MARADLARVALVGVAVTATVALALGTSAAVRGGPDDPAAGSSAPSAAPTATIPTGSGPAFGAPTFTRTGPHAVDIAAADFDSDGDADLAVASERSEDDGAPQKGSEISVHLSDGEGGFTRTRLAGNAAALATADVDGDGHTDLVAADQHRDRVTVHRGDGKGGFAKPQPHPTLGAQPAAVAVTDMDGDGDLDLAVANGGSSDIAVLLGDGFGGFGYPERYRSELEPRSMAALDLDGDGAAEIVTAGYGRVALHRNDGRGRLGKAEPVEADSPYAATVAAADVDGDGPAELLVGGRDAVMVMAADGSGGLGAPRSVEVAGGTERPTEVADIEARDLDGDGDVDLAVAGRYTGAAVAPADGVGRFGTPRPLWTGKAARAVAVADVDGDCAPDLVVAVGAYDDRLAVFRNTREVACPAADPTAPPPPGRPHGGSSRPAAPLGGPAFADARRIGLTERPSNLVTADFDGDGAPDVAVTLHYKSTVAVLRGDGKGGFAETQRVSTRPPRVGSGGRGMAFGAPEAAPATSTTAYVDEPVHLTAGDVDGDGDVDLAAAMAAGDAVAVLLNDGQGRFAKPRRIKTGKDSLPRWIAIADVDSDGDADLLTDARARAENLLVVIPGDGRGWFGAPTRQAGPTPREVADVDGDGDVDLLHLTNTEYVNGTRVAVRANDGGVFGDPVGYQAGKRLKWDTSRHLAVGDVDRDGHLDVAVLFWEAREAAVLLGDGKGGFGEPTLWSTDGGEPSAVQIADVTGDGAPDLVVANAASNELVVLAGDGRGGFGAATRQPTAGRSPHYVAIVDVDRDGAADLVSAEASGSLSVHRNTNTLARVTGRR